MNTIMSAVDGSGGSAEVKEAVNKLKEAYTNMVRNDLHTSFFQRISVNFDISSI